MSGTTITQLLGTSQSGKTTIASKLGKKGTASDVVLYNQPKKSITIIDPIKYPSSIIALLEFLSITDIPILIIPPRPMDRYTAELAITLELLKNKNTIVLRSMKKSVSPPEFEQVWISIKKQLKRFEHLLNSFILEIDAQNGEDISTLRDQILAIGQNINNERARNEDTTIVFVDHAFPVKGVGTVVLGKVVQGQVEKGMRMIAHPLGTNVIVRSIQIQDIDSKVAPMGSRVGLAIRGSFSTMKRGMILASSNSNFGVSETARISDFVVAPFSRNLRELKQVICIHGLQSFPVIASTDDKSVLLKAQKPFVWLSGLPVFLVDPNHSQRLLGIGYVYP